MKKFQSVSNVRYIEKRDFNRKTYDHNGLGVLVFANLNYGSLNNVPNLIYFR